MFRQIFGWLVLENNQFSHNANCHNRTSKIGSFKKLTFRQCKFREAAENWIEFNQFLNCLNRLFSCFLLKTLIGRHLEVGVKRNLAPTSPV